MSRPYRKGAAGLNLICEPRPRGGLRVLLSVGENEFPQIRGLASARGARLSLLVTRHGRCHNPGGALPSISLSFSLATILPPEPENFDFSKGAERVKKRTPPNP